MIKKTIYRGIVVLIKIKIEIKTKKIVFIKKLKNKINSKTIIVKYLSFIKVFLNNNFLDNTTVTGLFNISEFLYIKDKKRSRKSIKINNILYK